MRWWWLIFFKSLLVHLVNSKLNSNVYKFGKYEGSIVFNFVDNNRPNTKLDQIELTFLTYTSNCTLIRITSKLSSDHITIKLINGVPLALYNLGFQTHIISFNKFMQVNDGNYHRINFIRFGQNSTLQLDSNITVNFHPKINNKLKQYTIFNAQSRICLGGSNDLFLLNLLSPHEYIKKNKNNLIYNLKQIIKMMENENEILNNYQLNLNLFKQKLNSLKTEINLSKLRKHYVDTHFVGFLTNVSVNGVSILEMAANDDESVIVSGDVQLLVTEKNNLNLSFSQNYQNLSSSQQIFNEKKFIKLPNKNKTKDKNFFTNDYLIENNIQNDQPINEQINKNKNINKDILETNNEEDDLIFSGSGCYDDEDECTNFVDVGSGYDDLITPVYVPIKSSSISQTKLKNDSKINKQSNKYSNSNENDDEEEDDGDDDDDDDDNDDDDENTNENGSGNNAVSNSDEETTENHQNNNLPNLNNNNLDFIKNQFSEKQKQINSNTIEDDDRSILFTSQPIPPPPDELENIKEMTSKQSIIIPKRPSGNIEIVKLPLPLEPNVIFNSNNMQLNRGNTGKIKFNSIDHNQYNDINSFGNPDNNEDNLNLPKSNDDILGSIHINKNLIELKFSKTSADKTALIIAIIAILIILIVVCAPIVIFIKMRVKMQQNHKLNRINKSQITYQHQPLNKSYASLSASGSMHHTLNVPNASNNGLVSNTQNVSSNSNFHSNMHLTGALSSGLTLTSSTNPIYGTIDKTNKSFKNKDSGKEWYV